MNGKDTALFSKASDEWSTPQWLFEMLDEEFQFNVDAAANEENAKCLFRFDDALDRPWYEGDDPELIEKLDEVGIPVARTFWLNPPYSAGNIDKFMAKAYEESQKGAVVVCLVPCATDTRWWHNYVMKAQEIRFIKGRVRFVGYDEEGKQIKNSPTFSSCVVIFKHDPGKDCRIDMPWIGETIEQPRSKP
jgi:phage N-6-adenine-methyltransferase